MREERAYFCRPHSHTCKRRRRRPAALPVFRNILPAQACLFCFGIDTCRRGWGSRRDEIRLLKTKVAVHVSPCLRRGGGNKRNENSSAEGAVEYATRDDDMCLRHEFPTPFVPLGVLF